jgi:hypothetical protein
MSKRIVFIALIGIMVFSSCHKNNSGPLRYFEVGIVDTPADWRDSSFIIATSNPQMIEKALEQISLPVAQRRILNGAIARGNAGYNKNGGHSFQWHFKEDDWHLTDFSIEIYDGRPHSDLDLNMNYWIDTVKRFSPWNSYIKREIVH